MGRPPKRDARPDQITVERLDPVRLVDGIDREPEARATGEDTAIPSCNSAASAARPTCLPLHSVRQPRDFRTRRGAAAPRPLAPKPQIISISRSPHATVRLPHDLGALGRESAGSETATSCSTWSRRQRRMWNAMTYAHQPQGYRAGSGNRARKRKKRADTMGSPRRAQCGRAAEYKGRVPRAAIRKICRIAAAPRYRCGSIEPLRRRTQDRERSVSVRRASRLERQGRARHRRFARHRPADGRRAGRNGRARGHHRAQAGRARLGARASRGARHRVPDDRRRPCDVRVDSRHASTP